MRSIFLLVLMTLTLLGNGAAYAATAAGQAVSCPSELPMKAIAITAPPPGWTGFVPYEYAPGLPLTGTGLLSGPPPRGSELKPDEDAGSALRWSRIPAAADGVWAACYYGEGRLMMIAPSNVRCGLQPKVTVLSRLHFIAGRFENGDRHRRSQSPLLRTSRRTMQQGDWPGRVRTEGACPIFQLK